MIRKASTMLAAAGSVAFLVGSMGLTGAASAASLPSCASPQSHCTSNVAGALGGLVQNGGVAGYYGADDNHTHYRFVQTTVTASPQLVDLNGPLSSGAYPATVGGQLCDPNDGVYAQISLGYVDGKGYEVAYRVGRYSPRIADPCIQNNFQNNTVLSNSIFRSGNLLQYTGISAGDKVYVGIYYDPSGTHRHQLSFGSCDITTGVCRQAYTSSRYQLEFWEFGIGSFTPLSVLSSPASQLFETFSSNDVTCYSCAGMVPITSVSPVNSFGAGGLYEAQTTNSSSQTVLSPNDSLTPSSFNEYNGSTSI